jgi:hypothetical protein
MKTVLSMVPPDQGGLAANHAASIQGMIILLMLNMGIPQRVNEKIDPSPTFPFAQILPTWHWMMNPEVF